MSAAAGAVQQAYNGAGSAKQSLDLFVWVQNLRFHNASGGGVLRLLLRFLCCKRGGSEWAAVVSIRLCILVLTSLMLRGLFTKWN